MFFIATAFLKEQNNVIQVTVVHASLILVGLAEVLPKYIVD